MTLTEVLTSLCNELKTYRDIRSFIIKYNILPLGANGCTITSGDLMLIMKKFFDTEIVLADLNAQILSACASLGLSIEPMAAIDDLDNPVPALYKISLK